MKTKFNPILAQATQDKIAGDAFKLSPIPPGMVRFERHDYHYSQQGAVSLSHYFIKDVGEHEAINFLSGCCCVQWPDKAFEFFDFRVTPCKHDYHLGYGTITRANGQQTTGTLSRLPNVFCEYYGARLLTVAERATFKLHVFDCETH